MTVSACKKHFLIYPVLGVIRMLWLVFGTGRRVTLLGWSTPNSDVRTRAEMGIFFSHGVAIKSQFSSNRSSVA